MKRCIFTKVKFMALFLFAVLMTACTADVYEPKPDPDPKPRPDESTNGIPNDFDYSTKASHKLTVKVLDEYEGKRYYTIEVFGSDPITDPNSVFYVGGKTNSRNPFIVDLALPKTQEYIYIKKTDAQGYSTVVSLEVKDGDLLLDYTDPVITKSFLRSDSGISDQEITRWLTPLSEKEIEKLDKKAEMKDVIELRSGMTLDKNKSYKITSGKVNNVVFPDNENYTLYIFSGATLDLASSASPLTKNSQIVVFHGGQIIGSKAVLKIDGNSQLVNMGKVDINRIETLPSPHSSIYNHTNSEITVNSMHLNGGELHNHCLVKVGTFSFDGSASGLYLNRGSSVISGNFIYGYDTKISMAEHSLFETDALNPAQTGPVSLVVEDADANQYGDGNSAKLFKVNGVLDYTSVQITGFFWSDLYTYAQSEVNYSANKNGALRVVGNKCPVNISGDCFGDINYSKDEPFTDESETPEYKPEYDKTEAYVYLFEDNWPNFGDYDMNDLVMIVSIMNTTEASSEGINAKTVYLSTSVRAVGATKSLYAFAKIQGTDKVINLLEGKEAHEFMNSEPGQIINTYNKTCEARESLIEVDVNGMSGVVNANNLNVFIVWGDPNKNKKNEVHIVGFLGTEQAATALTSDEYYRYKYNENIDNSTEEFNNMMWGLMIPKSSFDSYPREGISIMDAYPQFMNWAKSGGKDVLDWYTLGVNDLLYQGDSAKDK
ncbi:LruC domain-containing protein [Parabacteroides distasonis]|jgi:hypothetical protein|uniref:LruC domain-containing protein n=1 Tax=Parabacteroides distasonis TaxID=823 RepID=UPI0005525335|nr:LruC domain-containing protein [Parabacteroides distasonis]MBM6515478.1 LruC domain-containing protein [Parabacteroides distasonis]UVQ93218.1 LruC domain-containing protein [Parabacteroides distasonis]UVR79749.1 LruC domain-containing protein [Parabacteroides distasonis]